MDCKDGPLQVLVAGPGGRTQNWPDAPVTQEVYDEAVSYFEERARWIAERPSRIPADGPATSHAPAVKLNHSYPQERVADPGARGLRDDYPAPVVVAERCRSPTPRCGTRSRGRTRATRRAGSPPRHRVGRAGNRPVPPSWPML
ncbi:DUF7639 domain-containing protein [Streptomyces sp. NPDC054794]